MREFIKEKKNQLWLFFVLFSLVPSLFLLMIDLNLFRLFPRLLSGAENSNRLVLATAVKLNKFVEILSQQDGSYLLGVKFPNYLKKSVIREGKNYELLKLEGGGFDEREEGKPALPFLSAAISVPAGSACEAEVLDLVSREIADFGDVYPAQPPQTEAQDEEKPLKFIKDNNFYSLDTLFPKDIVNLSEEISLRGSTFRIVYFYPLQFNPGKKILKSYTDFKAQVSCTGGGAKKSPESPRDFFRPLKDRIIGSSLSPSAKSQIAQASTQILGTASGADFLIITPPDFVPAAESLALWRRQKGLYTLVKTTAETGATADLIAAYIKNAYQTWTPSPSFVLLLGDVEFIPTNYKTPHPAEANRLIGTDLYYAAVDGTDYFPDLAVGRISVDTLAQAQDRIDKIINYEKAPPTESSFYTSQGIAAYFQDGEGGVYDGYDDRPFVKTSEQIRDFFLSQNYNASRIYYALSSVNPTNYNLGPFGNGEPLPAELLRANGFLWNGDRLQTNSLVNSGVFWLNHRDHGSILGWTQPNYTVSDVNSLNNGGKLPFVASFECFAGFFDTETDDPGYGTDPGMVSFAESWQRQVNGGAVAVTAFSRTSYSGFNDELNKGFVDAIWPNFLSFSGSASPIYYLGLDLNYAKVYSSTLYGEGIYRKLEFEELNLFGDPATEIWTGVPQNITLTVPDSVQAGSNSLTVSVSENGAMVTVVQNSSLLGTAISQNGSAIVSLNPSVSEGQLTITSSKHNFRPSLATVNVIKATAVEMAGCWPYRYADISVVVNWETASEADNLGFNVYFGQTADVSLASKVNIDIIPALGGIAGASYRFIDPARPANGYYWIESIETTGLLQKFGPYLLTTAPAGPGGLMVQTATTKKLVLSWTGSASLFYELEISKLDNNGRIISGELVKNIAGPLYQRIPGLAIGKYKFRVRVKYGEWSVYKSFRVSK